MNYFAPGTVIQDRYSIIKEIGRGRYSVVYKAEDIQLKQNVAVKQLIPPPILAKIGKEKTKKRVIAARSLNHPHIIQTYDYIDFDSQTLIIMDLVDRSLIIMELVDGTNLQTIIKQEGVLPSDKVVSIGIQIASALAAAHRRGIIHGNIKPNNIFLESNGYSRLSDFGSIRIEHQLSKNERKRLFDGLYTPPEVLDGKEINSKGDIFALGMTLYFALTGEIYRPLDGKFPALGCHVKDICLDVPFWLDEVIAKATCANPNDRFSSVARFEEALSENKSQGITLIDKSGMAKSLKKSNHSCLVCGTETFLGISICPGCKGIVSKPSTYLLLESLHGDKDKQEKNLDKIRALFNLSPQREGLKETISGTKALVCLDDSQVNSVVEELAKKQIYVRALSKNQLWKAIPQNFYGLTGAILGVGSFVSGGFSGLFAIGLLLLAHQSIGKPLLTPGPSQSKLPSKLQEIVVEIMEDLNSTTARNLFSDIVRISQIWFDTRKTPEQREEIVGYVSNLLKVSADAAIQLDGLDRTLSYLETQSLQYNQLPQGWLKSLEKCEEARNLLLQRLLEVAGILATAQSTQVLLPQGLGEELKKLTDDIGNELKIQAETAKGMELLLKGES